MSTIERLHRVLRLSEIDAPQLDARLQRDQELLEELARDILRNGMIEPIKVVSVVERYEVVDGFRRFLACKMAGLETIEAFIYPMRCLALEGVKYRANAFREDMSAADEAKYFYELYVHECEQDIDKLCLLVNKKLPYVDGRLQLLAGDELVFDALRDKKINIGVATELNKCTDPQYRRHFLHHAILAGATVTAVGGWVIDWKRSIADMPPAPERPPVDPAVLLASAYDPMRCYVCRRSIPGRIPQPVNIHASCLEAILDPLLAAGRGEQELEAANNDPRRI